MKRISLHIQGLVQGVGFRPFVYTLALKYNLKGFVANSAKGVIVELEGKEERLNLFLDKLQHSLPTLARIDSLKKEYIKLKLDHCFEIKKSKNDDKKISAIMPDQAICDDCLRELNDKNNRRYRYEFINCTNCGPRYSIIKDIPYDRALTSMKDFLMCDECKKEYENPLNRRYHAQPISCKNCGPILNLYIKDKKIDIDEKIEKIASLIKDGEIVAIKGIGGFHLVCDSTNSKTVLKLRDFKKRLFKPFALMCKDIKMVKESVYVDNFEKSALTNIQKPIVLMKKRDFSVSKLVAPHTDRLGIFLPNTPLHELLFQFLDNPIIATSANLKGEPIITKKEDLDEKFGKILGGILDYNRDILHPCDDSLVQMIDDKSVYLRVSRGIAPLTIPFNGGDKKVLAVGAMKKNAIAFYFDNRIVLSPYLGDMDSVKTFELFKKTIDDWKRFYDLDFDVIVCDKHLGYTTTKWAKSQKVKTISVNHHHAHILTTLIDRNISLNKKVLGVAFDGTGYGDDGTVWGGEFLVCEGRKYKRVAHFKPFKLLGGEKSIKNINRIAYSMLLDLKINLEEFHDIKFLSQMHKKNINSPFCSSVGRIFDAVCYFATGLKEVSYDGESGLILESLYDKTIQQAYTLCFKDGVIDYGKMIFEILEDRKKIKDGILSLDKLGFYGNTDEFMLKTSKLIASKFLNSLAKITLEISNIYNLPTVLGGGVFQNKTLLNILLKKSKNPIYFPQNISPNDGGICVGQIAYSLIED